MINIDVTKSNKKKKLLKPSKMLDNSYTHGTVFQMYDEGYSSEEQYFITCGPNEKHVINIWWNNEDDCYQLSTDDKKSLLSFSSHIRVVEIEADVTIGLNYMELDNE